MVGVISCPFCVSTTSILQRSLLLPLRPLYRSKPRQSVSKRSPFKVAVTPQMKLSNRSCGRWLAKDSTPLCGKKGNKTFGSNWTRFLCKVWFFVFCVMQGGWVSEGVICDFGWRGALRGWEGDHMWSSPPSKGHQSSAGVSRKAEKMKVLGNTFSVSMTELLFQQLSSFWMIDSTLSVITRTWDFSLFWTWQVSLVNTGLCDTDRSDRCRWFNQGRYAATIAQFSLLAHHPCLAQFLPVRWGNWNRIGGTRDWKPCSWSSRSQIRQRYLSGTVHSLGYQMMRPFDLVMERLHKAWHLPSS